MGYIHCVTDKGRAMPHENLMRVLRRMHDEATNNLKSQCRFSPDNKTLFRIESRSKTFLIKYLLEKIVW